MPAQYVLIGFNSDKDALAFLTLLDDRELLVAKRKGDGKVSLRKFKVRTAYLKKEEGSNRG